MGDVTSALEQKWAQEEEGKTLLQKAYENVSKKKTDGEGEGEGEGEGGSYRGKGQTDGGIYLTEKTVERQQIATVLGYVLKTGPLAYHDENKFPTGPWCKSGDWVLFGRYAGSRFEIEGGEVKILNDDEIIAKISNPEAILHNY